MSWIFVKHSNSKCNKELLSYLLQHKQRLKKEYNIKVIIIYEYMIPKLDKKITKLPVFINNGNIITGNEAIINYIKPKQNKQISDDIHSFWNNEIISGGDDELEDVSEEIKNKTLDRMMERKESIPVVRKKKETIENTDVPLNTDMSISDMDTDPIMRKYWENLESSPGDN